MKRENITLDSSMNELNKYIEKIKNLEQKIENEIDKINKTFRTIDKEITKTYEEKHQKLILEENKLKENLRNEVTKIQEKLEFSLTDAKNILTIRYKTEVYDDFVRIFTNEFVNNNYDKFSNLFITHLI